MTLQQTTEQLWDIFSICVPHSGKFEPYRFKQPLPFARCCEGLNELNAKGILHYYMNPVVPDDFDPMYALRDQKIEEPQGIND